MNTPSSSSPLLLALALLVAAQAASAQTVVDDFNDNNSTGWTEVSPLAGYNAAGTFTASGGTYRIQAPPSPDLEQLGPARAGAILNDFTTTDFFKVTVDLLTWDNQPETHQSIGIVARVSNVGLGTTSGYFFHYDPHGSNGNAKIWIELITEEQPFSLGLMEVTTPLDPTFDYRLEFTGVGSSLVGSVYLLSNLSTPLYTVSATDSTYTSGSVGLLVADQGALTIGNQSADATFDNFTATAVPEPATYAAMLGVAALGAAAIARRKRRSTLRAL